MNSSASFTRAPATLGRSAIAVAALLLALRTSAADVNKARAELVLIGGMNNVRHHDDQPFGAMQIRFARDYYRLHPYLNAGAAGHGSHYAGAGLLHTFDLPHKLKLAVGTGPGWYRHEQNDPDLGYAIEFNSWVELSAQIMCRRVGLSLAHLSNAHLGHSNPGTEALGVNIHY